MCVYFTGYGFVDFDSPAAAQKAVTALKSSGVQAQMAKVRDHFILYKLHNATTMCFKATVSRLVSRFTLLKRLII